MRFLFTSLLFLFTICRMYSQDTTYARNVIKYLTSKKCFGRGYVNNGLDVAAKYIVEELKANKAQPYFSTGYYQWFDFDVNTFPDKVTVKLNNKLLKPGADYILSPESGSVKGKYTLLKKDSVTYITNSMALPINVKIKKN